jgi:hypothetical protein
MCYDKSCSSCFFSDKFPGITIEENGKCTFCSRQNPESINNLKDGSNIGELFKTAEELKAKKAKYDCIIGSSGGLDSSYVLYVAKKVLNLNPLAIHYDHGFTYEIADQNLETICKTLNIELRTLRSRQQNDLNYVKYMVKALQNSGIYWGICSFCQYILPAVIYKVALKENIPAVLASSNPYEAELHLRQSFKLRAMVKAITQNGIIKLLRSLFYIILANYYLLKLKIEFYLPPLRNLISRHPKLPPIQNINITPFIGLDINKMVETLENETGWKSPWPQRIPMRFDCKIEDSLINQTYRNATGITVHGIICNNLIYDKIKTKDELNQVVSYYDEIIPSRLKEINNRLGLQEKG